MMLCESERSREHVVRPDPYANGDCDQLQYHEDNEKTEFDSMLAWITSPGSEDAERFASKFKANAACEKKARVRMKQVCFNCFIFILMNLTFFSTLYMSYINGVSLKPRV